MLELLREFAGTLLEGTKDTLYMTFLATLFAYLLGLPMGVLLSITAKGGVAENLPFNSVFGWCVNIGRSIPFVVLMVAIVPFTRLVAGKIIGPTAAIVPLVVGSAPFVARMVEGSLAEIDAGVLEAAQCMGATRRQLITKVLLRESVPSLIRGFSITCITLIGYSAMAGAVGAGGLGDIAIRYGLHRYQPDVMLLTIILLILLVCAVQVVFDCAARAVDKRNR